jgi:hypothetical protein
MPLGTCLGAARVPECVHDVLLVLARILLVEKGIITMLYARIIVGIALILIAAIGPFLGLPRVTNPKLGQSPASQDGEGGVRQRGVGHADRSRATVLILRIFAGLLGAWLLIFSSIQLLRIHSHPAPSTNTQPDAR